MINTPSIKDRIRWSKNSFLIRHTPKRVLGKFRNGQYQEFPDKNKPTPKGWMKWKRVKRLISRCLDTWDFYKSSQDVNTDPLGQTYLEAYEAVQNHGKPSGPFTPRKPRCVRFSFDGGYADIPFTNVNLFNGIKCNAIYEGTTHEGYLMLNNENCKEPSYIDIFTDNRNEEPEYIHLPIIKTEFPEISLDITAENLFEKKIETDIQFTAQCIRKLKKIIPEGKELDIELSDYDCKSAFLITDNSCRAPYPEWSVKFPKKIRHKDGELEVAESENRYITLERPQYTGWTESVQSIYFRAMSIHNGHNMDYSKTFELKDIRK